MAINCVESTSITGVIVHPLTWSRVDMNLRAEDNHFQKPASVPAAPRTVEESGLHLLFLVELTAKILFLRGNLKLAELAHCLKLPVSVVDIVLRQMRAERLSEVAHCGPTDGDIRYNLTETGRARASEFLRKSQYAGAAPVTLDAYIRQVRRQAISSMRVTLGDLNTAFDGLMVRSALREQLGAAMNSGRALFLYGPAGSGKTFLAEQMLRLLSGCVAIPYAICVDDNVIQVFDPVVHKPVAQEAHTQRVLYRAREFDERWVLCSRPVSLTGGELTLDMLNLHFDETTRFYQAPPHVKANNGLFIIDDLGRQIVSPQQLMNRWIVPMDRGHDYQALHNGYKFAIPFDVILVFSTNMAPRDIVDEAFLRRIGYKIHVGALDEAEYRRVFQVVCEEKGVPYSDAAVEYLIREHHDKEKRPLLACFPRDIVGQIRDFALFRQIAPELTRESLDWAWHNYFASA
jgi:predicted ATPase with chaperone activity